MNTEPLFELENVGLRKGGKQILSGISFSIYPNECFVLAGENGAGKSSLIRLLNRLDDPGEGEIRLDGQSLKSIPLGDLRKRVGMVMQGPVLFDGIVRDVLTQIGLTLKRELDADRLVADLGLPSALLDRETADLSGGETQLIAIGILVQLDPDILLMDEPASALSVTAMERMEDIMLGLKQNGKTIIQVTHHIDRMMERADRGVFLEAGRLRAVGSMQDVAACFRTDSGGS